ncbi:MAG: GTP cyclohydrolase II [Halocynthiibacter sp.]
MSLLPTSKDLAARARADLRMGMGIVIADGDEGVLIFAVETLPPDRLAVLEAPHLTITHRRAQTLKTAAYDGDILRVALRQDADLSWLHAIADPAEDLSHPMKGPLIPIREGRADFDRMGIALVKSARLLPAIVAMPIPAPTKFAQENLMTCLNLEAMTDRPSDFTDVIHARLPMRASEAGRVHVFRPDDGMQEHYAIEIGKADRTKPILVRLHSACFTGDVLGSLKCDCGPQLNAALGQMGAEGEGILLYLNQEGRGIGLANKMRAYSLQDQGFDTVEANHRLGFEDDERNFAIGASLLKELGVQQIKLLTNNPNKVARMESCGIKVVERIPLQVGKSVHNEAYLATKAAKSGHFL